MSPEMIFNALVPVVWACLAWRLWRSDRRERDLISAARRLVEAYDNTHRESLMAAIKRGATDEDLFPAAGQPDSVPEWWSCSGVEPVPHAPWRARIGDACGVCGRYVS